MKVNYMENADCSHREGKRSLKGKRKLFGIKDSGTQQKKRGRGFGKRGGVKNINDAHLSWTFIGGSGLSEKRKNVHKFQRAELRGVKGKFFRAVGVGGYIRMEKQRTHADIHWSKGLLRGGGGALELNGGKIQIRCVKSGRSRKKKERIGQTEAKRTMGER